MYLNYTKAAFFSRSAPAYTLDQVAKIAPASIGVGVGAAPRQIVVLQSVNGRDHRWVTGDPATIVTRGGRVLSTAGYPSDLTATRLIGDDPVDGQLHTLPGRIDRVRIVDFKGNQVFGQRLRCRFKPAGQDTITVLGRKRQAKVVKERCKAPKIHWRFTNTYWADPRTGKLLRSRQHVHPRLDAFIIEPLRPSKFE